MRPRLSQSTPRQPIAAPSARDISRHKRRVMLMRLFGLGCGLLIAVVASRLELGAVIFLAPLQSVGLMGALGLLLGASRARWLGPLGVAALVALTQLVERTTWAEGAARGLTVRDRIVRSDAVVVLAADIFADGTPTPQSQRRLSHAYGLLRVGWSPRLVLTRFAPPRPSYAPIVRRQMKSAGLEAEVLEAGPIRITRDEARQVSTLARERAWKRVILVTDRSHTRRARALFREAGLRVLCSPCSNPAYDLARPLSAEQRRTAFRDWLYETVWHHAHFSLRLI